MNPQASNYYAHGKLLLTAEYFVLDGAVALAIPTKFGQKMWINPIKNKVIHKKSVDNLANCWFSADFNTSDLAVKKTSNEKISDRFQQILKAIHTLNPSFLKQYSEGLEIRTELEFPRDWGLGSSSTLIYNLAQWAQVDAIELLKLTFGGSGYDIACAGADGPILYQRNMSTQSINFEPSFKENIYFVYLGKKQNSRDGIARYRAMGKVENSLLKEVSNLANEIINCTTLNAFEKLLKTHENLVANYLQLEKVASLYFQNYWGAVKSLGAWGGDFVLATSNRNEKETKAYFNERGFDVVIPYSEMIL